MMRGGATAVLSSQFSVLSCFGSCPQCLLEILHVVGAEHGVGAIHKTALDEPGEAFLEGKRSVLPGNRDLLVQMLERIAANVLACAVADEQQLGGRHTT